jgi:NADPH:quinone reductase-like Zn-dependent oxidoreductase
MQSCGVCNGTDLKLIHGRFKNFDTYPAALGHEGVGKVVEVGSKVKNLKVGDIVLLPFVEEKLDDVYSGWGSYSEYAVVGDAEAYISNGMGPGTPEFSEGYFPRR